MDDKIKEYIDSKMAQIPRGIEIIREYRDERKWISSDSRMSIPGSKGNLKELINEIEIKAFLLSKYPVTLGLYNLITHKISDTIEMDATPMVNISWHDAVSFCNLLSKECGFKECYSFDRKPYY